MSVIGALPVRQGFFLGAVPLSWNKAAWRNLMLYGAYHTL
jgi:hypothetical protein